MKKERCMFCGGEATLLCDGVLGYLLVMYGDRRCIDPYNCFTCDAPMCRSCATHHGNIHFSGAHGFNDTIDFCPICMKENPQFEFTKRIFDSVPQVKTYRAAHYARNDSAKARHLHLLRGGGQQSFNFNSSGHNDENT